tara:strand:- start:246 stop:395 length:150 start_codon:yes stop_codon:yes gene_type:complete
MIDKMLFVEVKPNVVVRYGVERHRELEKKKENKMKRQKKMEKKKLKKNK